MRASTRIRVYLHGSKTVNVSDISPEFLERLAQRKAHNDSMTRFAAIDAQLTPEWKAGMTERLRGLDMLAASPRSKLAKIYAILDDVNALKQPHAACKAGCNACCHIQVEISDREAQRIGAAIGKKPAALPPGRLTTPMDQLGRRDTPCPFLVDGNCSIYPDRPYVCREMTVLDLDALACSFENMALARAGDDRVFRVPQAKAPPVAEVHARVVAHPNMTLADIRQFFPAIDQPPGARDA